MDTRRRVENVHRRLRMFGLPPHVDHHVSFISAVCQQCGTGFTYRKPKVSRLGQRKYCGDMCRRQGQRQRQKVTRQTLKVPHRNGSSKEKVLRCPKCESYVTWDVRNDGYVDEVCRCGRKAMGAVS